MAAFFPPHVGGLEKCVWEISKQLANNGHEVLVYTTRIPGTKPYEKPRQGVTIKRLPILFSLFTVPVSLFLELLKEHAQVIHVHIPPATGAFSSILLGRMRKIPIVVTYHNETKGNGFIGRVAAKMYNAIQYRFILKSASIVTVPSKVYKIKLVAAGVDNRRVKVIPNGIACSYSLATASQLGKIRRKYGLLDGERIILFVGALEKRKGVEYLIRAVPEVVKRINNARAIIVGDGSQKENLVELTERLGVAEHVIFAGHVDEAEKNSLYNVADILVLPSLYETFGLVLLEAMYHEKPIISSRIAGTSELLTENYNCILVQPKDYKALANAIVVILSDRALAQRIVKNAKTMVSRYAWEDIVPRLIDVYENIRV